MVSGAADIVTGVVSSLYNGIKSTFGFVWDVISWPFKQIGNLVSGSFGGIINVVKGAGEFISNTFKWVIDKVTNFLNLVKGAISAVAGFFGFEKEKTTAEEGGSKNLGTAALLLLQAAKALQVVSDKLVLLTNIKTLNLPAGGAQVNPEVPKSNIAAEKANAFSFSEMALYNTDKKLYAEYSARKKELYEKELAKLGKNASTDEQQTARAIAAMSAKIEFAEKAAKIGAATSLSPSGVQAKNVPTGPTVPENSGFLSRTSDVANKISPDQSQEKAKPDDKQSDRTNLTTDLTSQKSAKTIETVNDQLIALNKVSAEMLRYLKEMSDYSRRNVDATRSLNRDFFKA